MPSCTLHCPDGSLPPNVCPPAALWAQLANLERQRARQRERRGSASAAASPSGSYAIARAFFAAAAACFAALTPAWAGGALRAAAERAEGLTRVYASWGQLELQQQNVGAGRTLLRRGVGAAREHPAGAAAAGAPRLLVTWATREWRSGELVEAQRLCVEALDIEPANSFALTLLGSIEAAAGQADVARRLFGRAVEVDPRHTAALQAWARLEASSGEQVGRARRTGRQCRPFVISTAPATWWKQRPASPAFVCLHLPGRRVALADCSL